MVVTDGRHRLLDAVIGQLVVRWPRSPVALWDPIRNGH